MTIKEAITYFKHRLNCGQCGENTTQRVAFEGAIDALEKQIPKKTVDVWRNDNRFIACGNCGYIIGYYGDIKIPANSECRPYCGQRIDWSDEDDTN